MKYTIDQALTLHRAGRLSDAEKTYKDILSEQPDDMQVLYGLAVLLLQQGKIKDAIFYLRILEKKEPTNPEYLNALGSAQLQSGEFIFAKESFEKALDTQPNNVLALSNLGTLFYKLGELQKSEEMLAGALAIDPNNAEANFNFSQLLRSLGNLEKAETFARKALELAPKHLGAKQEYAATRHARGDLSGAEKEYREIINIDPKFAEAQHNLSMILLQSGQFKEGWERYEWRWETPDFSGSNFIKNIPSWDGQKISEGTLLIWTEQGIGDQIIYSSMINEVEGFAPHIVIACQERLVTLFRRSFHFADIFSQAEIKSDSLFLSKINFQIPVASLGKFFRNSWESFPQKIYLEDNKFKTIELRENFKSKYGNKKLVGLSWKSNNPRYGKQKSVSIEAIAEKFKNLDVIFFDLQYGDNLRDREIAKSIGMELINDNNLNKTNDLELFSNYVAAMDLIISVSNTTAHFSGALGTPCWVMLSKGIGQFWYWFLDRKDTPWYPKIKLYRQQENNIWTDVLQNISNDLRQITSTKTLN